MDWNSVKKQRQAMGGTSVATSTESPVSSAGTSSGGIDWDDIKRQRAAGTISTPTTSNPMLDYIAAHTANKQAAADLSPQTQKQEQTQAKAASTKAAVSTAATTPQTQTSTTSAQKTTQTPENSTLSSSNKYLEPGTLLSGATTPKEQQQQAQAVKNAESAQKAAAIEPSNGTSLQDIVNLFWKKAGDVKTTAQTAAENHISGASTTPAEIQAAQAAAEASKPTTDVYSPRAAKAAAEDTKPANSQQHAMETTAQTDTGPEKPDTYTTDNVASYLDRLEWLASQDTLTIDERKEARQADRALVKAWAQAGGGEFAGYSMNDVLTLDRTLTNKDNALAAFGNALLKGLGINSLFETANAAVQKYSDSENLKNTFQSSADTMQQNYSESSAASPIASGAGQTTGGLLSLLSISSGVNDATAAVSAASKKLLPLVKIAQNAITFAGSTAIQEAGSVASGQESGGEYAKDIAISGAGGAGATIASGLVSSGMKSILVSNGLQTQFMDWLTRVASGVSFVGGQIATEYPLEETKPTKEQIAVQLTTAFLFSMVQGYVDTAKTTAENKTALDSSVSKMMDDYKAMASGSATPEETIKSADKMLQYSADIRGAISQNYYAGQQQYINEVKSALDGIDEYVKTVRQTAVGQQTPALTEQTGAIQQTEPINQIAPVTSQNAPQSLAVNPGVVSPVTQTNEFKQSQNAPSEIVQATTPTAEQASIFDATKGPGAAGLTVGPQVPSQNNLVNDQNLSPETQKSIAGSVPTHERISEALANAKASAQMILDTGGNWVNTKDVVDDLADKISTGQQILPEDVKLAERVMQALDKDARKSGDRSAIEAFNREIIQPMKTPGAQATQAWAEFSRGPMGVVSDAQDILDKGKVDVDANTPKNTRRVRAETEEITDAVSQQVDGAAETAAKNATDFLNGNIQTIVTNAAKATDNGIKDLLIQNWQNKQNGYEAILKYVTQQYGLTGADAETAANRISTEFYDELATRSEKALEQTFRKRERKQMKTFMEKAVSLINEGALTSDTFRDLASEKLFGSRVSDKVLNKVSDYAETAQELYDNKDSDGLAAFIVKVAGERGYKANALIKKYLYKGTLDDLYNGARSQTLGLAFDAVPPSVGKIASAYQNQAYLLNAKTILRNIVSNIIMAPVDRIANNFGTLPDLMAATVMSKINGLSIEQNRTVGYEPGMWGKGVVGKAKSDVGKNIVDIALDMNRNADAGKYELPTTRIFPRTVKAGGKNYLNPFNVAEGALGYALNTPDVAQKGITRGESEAALNPLVGSGGRVTPEIAADMTQREMLYRSFQRPTVIGDFLQLIGKDIFNVVGLGTQGGKMIGSLKVKDFGLGDFVSKYTRVPGAIATTTFEYSPAGYLKAFYDLGLMVHYNRANPDLAENRYRYKDMPNSTASVYAQRDFAQDLGRAFTGSGLIIAGGIMVALGILVFTPRGGDDKNKTAAEAGQGQTGLQFNLSGAGRVIDTGESTSVQDGDILISLDWLQPIAGELEMGARLEQLPDDATFVQKTGQISEALANSFANLSMMTTVHTVANDVMYAKEGETPLDITGQILKDFGSSSATGLIPGPIRQVAQAADNTYRNTNGDSFWQNFWNQAMYSIPGARQNLLPKITATGENKTYTNNPILNYINSLVLPGQVNIYKGNNALDYLSTLPRPTGGGSVYPSSTAPKAITADSQSYTLTVAEQTQYQQTANSISNQLVKQFMESSYASGMSTQEQADIVSALNDYSKDRARKAILEARGIAYDSDWDDESKMQDLPLYLAMKQAVNTLKDSDGKDTASFDAAYKAYKALGGRTVADYSQVWTTGQITTKQEPSAAQTAISDNIDGFSDLAAAVDAGISPEKYYSVYGQYKAINKSGEKASEKSNDFAYWLDQQSGLSASQKEVLKSNLTYGNWIPTSSETYDSLVSAGVPTSTAQKMVDGVQGLEPEDGKTQVSDAQRFYEIATGSGSDADKKRAMSVYMDDNQYDDFQSAMDAGIPLRTYASYIYDTSGYAADKDSRGNSVSGSLAKKVIRYIGGLSLTSAQKTALAELKYAASTVNKYKTW